MKLRRCSVNMLKRMSKKKKLLCFGAGQNLHNFFSSHKEEKLEERIAFILDNNIAKNGEHFKINGVNIEIKLPDVLKELRLSEYIILITAGKYAEIFAQIQNLCNNANIDVYMLPIRRSIFWYWIEFAITKLPIKNYILKEAFSVIGRYSAEDQISEIEFCRKKLNEIYLKNENEFRSKSKLSKSFGVLAGAFLIIIFI